jgi:hypothetical protein
MYGQLTYRDEQSKGFDPVNDPLDLFFDALGCVLSWVSIEGVVELLLEVLFCFIELL